MQVTAKEIAQRLKGTIEGDENVKIWKPCKIEEGCEGGITFLANPKYTHYVYERQASVVIVSKSFTPERPIPSTLIRVDNPYLAVASLLRWFNQQNAPKKGRSCRSSVDRTAKVGKGCYIGTFAFIGRYATIGNNVKIYPQAYIGDHVTVGDNTILYPGVKLYANTVIGSNCILHAGVVVGADGFGFAPKDDGSYSKIDQIGNVVIEDDVEIGANTCIDSATMGSTVIHKGVKLDNLCQVAHNVSIGHDTVMASQSGIAGSAKVGSNCIIAGQSGIVGHIEIGNHVTIGAKSGVTRRQPDNATVWGSPAMDSTKRKKMEAHFRNIEALVQKVEQLEKTIAQLSNSKQTE